MATVPTTLQETFEALITGRYGDFAPEVLHGFEAFNPTLETIFAHKSTRAFKDEALPDGTVELLAVAAQSASSSSNLQAWSLVAVQDKARKDKAAEIAGNQEFIRQAPLFLVFVADLARLEWVCELENSSAEGLDYFEMFLIAALDAALAAQNAAVAAQSLGLGICYVGAARNKPRELAAHLELPPRTVAIFGLAVGIPQDDLTTTIKPRLPQPGLLHYETYNTQNWESEVRDYNEGIGEFYAQQGLPNPSWTKTSAKRVGTKESLGRRWELKQILRERGFELK